MTPGFPVIPCREEQVHKGRAAEAEGSEQLKGTKGTCTLRLNLSGALAFTGSASDKHLEVHGSHIAEAWLREF